MNKVFKYLIAIFLVGVTHFAIACPEGQFNVCFIKCVCVQNSGEFIKQTPFVKAQSLYLQSWIKMSRDSAIGSSSRIPINIRSQMLKYYPQSILDKVRYKVGDNGVLNTAKILFNNESVNAVTLIDLVIFRDDTASRDPSIWVHELKHVEQYKSWGLEKFADKYISNYNDVENPAYKIQDVVSNTMLDSSFTFDVCSGNQSDCVGLPAYAPNKIKACHLIEVTNLPVGKTVSSVGKYTLGYRHLGNNRIHSLTVEPHDSAATDPNAARYIKVCGESENEEDWRQPVMVRINSY